MTGSLFDRRLVFVVGKGGVGKTTVTAALGLAARRRKDRVLLVELETENRLLPLLGRKEPRDGSVVEILPGLFRMNVSGKAALEEYLSLTIPVRRVLRAVFESRVYQYFVAAAPGLKELMTVGKIWYEVDQGRWDLVIVDAPATGHSLQYLRMPKAALETFRSGLVHREARRVWELLRDPEKTEIVVVTIAEEMPVNETLEICHQTRVDLGLPGQSLIVNRFHTPFVPLREVEALRPGALRVSEHRALVDAVLSRAVEEASWAELNESYRRKLEAESGWQLLVLPFLFREEFGVHDLETLATGLAERLEPTAPPGATRLEARR